MSERLPETAIRPCVSSMGRPLAAMDRRAIARHIAVVPQDTPVDVPFSVREVVMLGRYAHGSTWEQESPEDAGSSAVAWSGWALPTWPTAPSAISAAASGSGP